LLREVKRLRQGVANLEATLCQHGLEVPNVVEDIEVDAPLGKLHPIRLVITDWAERKLTISPSIRCAYLDRWFQPG
jgi:hypothetical protein